MLNVIAQYHARAGQGDTVAAALSEHVAASRKEPGCTQFVVLRSRTDGDRFVIVEEYLDEAAFEAHRASPHFRTFVEGRVLPLLAERLVDRYDEVAPGEGGAG